MTETILEADTQVLEFALDGRAYCVDIAHVDEIVGKEDELTPLPNSAPQVEGIMDLRGRTTMILNPKHRLGLDGAGIGERIIVFETDETRAIGWVIDEVREVSRVDGYSIDESVEDDSLEAIIKRDDGFVLWVDPDAINEHQSENER